MKRELQQKLFTKYPKIFRQKDLPCSETCMCWGIAVENGWYTIIDCLCNAIQNYNVETEAAQVKEKFGGLRFYYEGGDDFVAGLVRMAEEMSYCTCEYCGSTKLVSQTKGWIKTLCEDCMILEDENND